MLPGDHVVVADGVTINTWAQWVDYVRDRPLQDISIQVLREGGLIELTVKPDSVTENGEEIGRIGAYVQLSDEQ